MLQRFDFCFQLHSLRFIFARELHKPLVADFSGSVVLIKPPVQMGNGVISGNRLLKFCLTAFLLLLQILVGLLGEQFCKSSFIVTKKLDHSSKFQHHNLFNSVRPHIMPSGAAPTVVHLVIGTHEIVNFLIDRVSMIPQVLMQSPQNRRSAKILFFPF